LLIIRVVNIILRIVIQFSLKYSKSLIPLDFIIITIIKRSRASIAFDLIA